MGVCAAWERARWSVWDMPAALVPANYLDQVRAAGAVALLIPPDPRVVDDPGLVLDRLDGLMLVGGVDIGADAYGAEAHPLNDPPIPLRDDVEAALVRAAVARGLPVLGICRGAQVINVAAGGTLRQHLPDDLGTEEHRRAIGRFAGNEHDVDLEEGSLAHRAIGARTHRVASHHHQAIDAVGEGLRVSGRSADGVPEAVEGTGDGWLLGVQWHPEADPGSPVIAALVGAARNGRRRGADREEGGDLSIRAARRDERS
ncbi:MAG: gamma-glutamyl-gamma-aminobutyrate hydrolase family protein [Thermoleophilia bacterium]